MFKVVNKSLLTTYLKKTITILILLSSAAFNVQGAIITYFNSSNYNSDINAMNTSLGIDASFIVEDFENNTLIDGLTVTDNFDGVGMYRLLSRSDAWDGSMVLYGHPSYALRSPLFSFDLAVSVFGISISGYQPGSGTTELFINGVSQGALMSGSTAATQRNTYLKIEAEAGEAITSVGFTQPVNDGIGYDHLSVSYGSVAIVPEPATSALLLLGLACIGLRSRKCN
jgi:hypothetical protein